MFKGLVAAGHVISLMILGALAMYGCHKVAGAQERHPPLPSNYQPVPTVLIEDNGVDDPAISVMATEAACHIKRRMTILQDGWSATCVRFEYLVQAFQEMQQGAGVERWRDSNGEWLDK